MAEQKRCNLVCQCIDTMEVTMLMWGSISVDNGGDLGKMLLWMSISVDNGGDLGQCYCGGLSL